ncbi:MAG: FISUMP domain-containing protein [Bacteroidota bacterium]
MKLHILFCFIALFSFVGCEEEPTIEEEYDSLDIDAHIIHVSEYGKKDGAIYLTVTGGKTPYSYLWSTTANVDFQENLYPGIYWVQVTDARDSVITDTFEITEPPSAKIVITHTATLPSDAVSEDGGIELIVNGGIPPYRYEWSTGDTSAQLTNITVGEYIVTVHDSINQSETDTISIPVPSVTDVDGNSYPIIKLGEQIWMQENLRVKHKPDGTNITECYDYDNNPDNSEIYGKLYTWNALMNGNFQESTQGICPDGWHVPSDEEWKELEIFLGMTRSDADLNNIWRGVGIGTALLEGGSSNFDILLSGRMSSTGTFSLLNSMEYQWTSTASGNTNAFRRCFAASDTKVGRWDTFPKTYAFSVRCVKNNN